MPRPRLEPHARVLTRGNHTIQVGLSPHDGLVLVGVDDVEARQLGSIDGTRLLADILNDAESAGCDAHRFAAILSVLERRGLLASPTTCDPTDPPRRVIVAGDGHLAAEIARCLRLTGARVSSGALAGHAHDLELRSDGPLRCRPADLVVLVGYGAVDDGECQPWLRRGIAHLPVAASHGAVEIGPCIAGDGPCLRCIHMHQADHDPAWPTVLAQLTAPSRVPPDHPDPASGLATVAAGLVAMVAQAWLNRPFARGSDPRTGLAWQITAGLPHVVARRWAPHPGCPCRHLPTTMDK